jgi:hypothetical protein
MSFSIVLNKLIIYLKTPSAKTGQNINMGHIAHLSNTGSYENTFRILIYIHFLLPHLTLRSHDFNKLAYALCQKASQLC